MSVHFLGIRHHGPGSARAVATALAELRPDVVLIEGPPEADKVVELAGSEEMEPPVALAATAAVARVIADESASLKFSG